MKAIILAAGQGTRLRPLTDDKPKCMVELLGKSLLERQVEVLKSQNITDITVLAGYREDKIQIAGVNKLINPRYASTNMVYTLFSAKETMTGKEDLIISYGDIVYEPKVLSALVSCNAPICLTIDKEWRRYWELRMENPLDDAETLKVENGKIVELGKKPTSYDEIQGQYMGLMKIRAEYVKPMIDAWENMDKNAHYDGKSYNNMFMTSFIQHLIDIGWKVAPAWVSNGWLEVDSVEDLEIYERKHKTGELRSFINI